MLVAVLLVVDIIRPASHGMNIQVSSKYADDKSPFKSEAISHEAQEKEDRERTEGPMSSPEKCQRAAPRPANVSDAGCASLGEWQLRKALKHRARSKFSAL